MKMKYEFQVRMQQRHLKTIVGALRFRQRFLAGDVYGTIGRVAMDAWGTLPDVAHGAYPARNGEKETVQMEVLKACRVIEDAVWRNRRFVPVFSGTPDGRLAAELLSQNKTKERRTRFSVKLRKGVLRNIGWAVEFELRARIGHLEAIVAHLNIGLDVIRCVNSQCERMKAMAWQIVGGNYGPWFTYRTRFLYDIYSAIQHEEGHWRYNTVIPLVPSVPLMEISRALVFFLIFFAAGLILATLLRYNVRHPTRDTFKEPEKSCRMRKKIVCSCRALSRQLRFA